MKKSQYSRFSALAGILAYWASLGSGFIPATSALAQPTTPVVKQGSSAPNTTATAPTAANPILDKATGLREAANLLEKADKALQSGNRNLAEMFFSSAELFVGSEALADIATKFRAGAPPRIDAPLIKVADTGKQPEEVGKSEEDEAKEKVPPKPERGSLTGTIDKNTQSQNSRYVVTLEPVGRKVSPRAPVRRTIEQRDREFAPRVAVVPVNSTIVFPNRDAVFHNVFSTSKVFPFDLGLYKGGDAREVKFTQEGIIRLGCNLHANMASTVFVVNAPYYAIASANGTFAFKSVRPGKYKLKVWSESTREPSTTEITIKPSENSVKVGASTGIIETLTDKFGVPRG